MAVLTHFKNWLAPLGLAFLFSACSEPVSLQEAKGQVAGLSFQVHYAPVSANQTEARVNEQIFGLIAYLEQQFSVASVSSDLIKINQWLENDGFLLTRELEDYIRAGIAADELTESRLPLYSLKGEPIDEAMRKKWLSEGLRVPFVWVHNHHLFKRVPEISLNYDLLLAGFILDRVGILMGQMGIQYFHIEVANQHLFSRPFLKRSQTELPVLTPTGKRPALGAAPCQFAPDCFVYSLSDNGLNALAFTQWMARLNVKDALVTAERLNVPILIEIHENNSVQRYTSRTYP